MFKLSLRLIIVENSCSKLHGVIPAMHLPVAVFLWSFNQDFQLSLQFSLIHSSGSISGSRTFLISSGGCLSCCLNVSQTLSVTSTSTSISTNLCLCLYPFNSNGSFRSCRCWRCSSRWVSRSSGSQWWKFIQKIKIYIIHPLISHLFRSWGSFTRRGK